MAVPVSVSAQALSPNITAADKARSEKIAPLAGNWTCSDTGGRKPYTATAKLEGAWIVWRDTSDNASSDYLGWSQQMQSYIVAEIYSGGVNVSTTTDRDPLNATWKHQFPLDTSIMSTSFANGAFTVSVKYVNKSGKSRTGSMVCKKVS
jgi:hypothetical protein